VCVSLTLPVLQPRRRIVTLNISDAGIRGVLVGGHSSRPYPRPSGHPRRRRGVAGRAALLPPHWQSHSDCHRGPRALRCAARRGIIANRRAGRGTRHEGARGERREARGVRDAL
jgi:hypothetical protein